MMSRLTSALQELDTELRFAIDRAFRDKAILDALAAKQRAGAMPRDGARHGRGAYAHLMVLAHVGGRWVSGLEDTSSRYASREPG